MYEDLPQAIKDSELFCNWVKAERQGKVVKIPTLPDGRYGDVSDDSKFGDFKSRVDALSTNPGLCGIGIKVKRFIYLDIDDCVVDGHLDSRAERVLKLLGSRCYAEYSPSGHGLRIAIRADGFTYDKDRYYIKNPKEHIEVYAPGATNRFVTFTGNAIQKYDLSEDAAEELMQVLEEFMVRTQTHVTPKNSTNRGHSYLTDDEVIDKATTAVNCFEFNALWEGDALYETGADHSSLDLSLCTRLAFWCGGDAEQIDRLFRESALMRDKWDSKRGDTTYGEMTIQKAIAGCTDFYNPNHIRVNAAEDFNAFVDMLSELNTISNPRYRWTDQGFGRLLADLIKHKARYLPERKAWVVYDGTRWVVDVGAMKVMELAKDIADALILYAVSIPDEDKKTEFLKKAHKWQDRRFREIYIREAQSVYPVMMREFDADRFLFNCVNGTLDLRTLEFREHDPEDRITKISPVTYDADAHCQRFDDFISEIMSGDKDKAKYLQKALGYAITGDTKYECMFFLYGETTRNGKGTLMESILHVMGDYGLSVRPETIALKTSVNSQNPTEDIARLAGIRFANISEPQRGLLINAAQVKSMTGNDTLNARFLHENSFDFKPQFKLYVNTNYLPVITDMTLFTSGRVLIVPFDRHFEEWEQDKDLKSTFAMPETQSAILNWLIEGYRLLLNEGFAPPVSVKDATAAYFHDSDKVAQFAEDRLEEYPGGEVRTSLVYDSYKQWCMENGCLCENSKNFNLELRKFGTVVRRRPKSGGEKTTLLLNYKLCDFKEFLS